MAVCGLGGPELVIIALLAFVVIGPERTREVALAAGRFLREAMQTQWWRDATRMIREMRDLPNTLVRLAELEEAQAEIAKSLTGLQDDLQLDRDATVDPWGIENAVAGSTPPDERMSEEPAGAEEAPAPEAEPQEVPDDPSA